MTKSRKILTGIVVFVILAVLMGRLFPNRYFGQFDQWHLDLLGFIVSGLLFYVFGPRLPFARREKKILLIAGSVLTAFALIWMAFSLAMWMPAKGPLEAAAVNWVMFPFFFPLLIGLLLLACLLFSRPPE